MKSRPVRNGIITATNDTEIGDAEKFMEESLDRILEKESRLRTICEQFCQQSKLAETNYFALIHASAGKTAEGNDIEFLDGDKIESFRKWLRIYEGSYGVVIADMPNSRNSIVYPKQSLLVMKHKFDSCNIFSKGPEAEFKLMTPNYAVISLEQKSQV